MNFPEIMRKLLRRNDLTQDEAYAVMTELLGGHLTEGQTGGYLAALAVKRRPAPAAARKAGYPFPVGRGAVQRRYSRHSGGVFAQPAVAYTVGFKRYYSGTAGIAQRVCGHRIAVMGAYVDMQTAVGKILRRRLADTLDALRDRRVSGNRKLKHAGKHPP